MPPKPMKALPSKKRTDDFSFCCNFESGPAPGQGNEPREPDFFLFLLLTKDWNMEKDNAMDERTIEFVTFAIGSVAERLQRNTSDIYRLFKKLDVIGGYLVPAYGVLHTYGRQYLVDDLLEFMQEKGVRLC